MRYIIIISFVLLVASISYAEPCPIDALTSYLEASGNKGSAVSVKQDKGKWIITRWEASIPKPTDEEMSQIVKNYKPVEKKSLEDRVALLEKEIATH